MKRFLVAVCLLVTSGFIAVRAQTLVLLHADGTSTDVELATQPKVTFENDKVLITSTILNMEYPKKDVLRFTFKSGMSSIQSTKNNVGFSKENNNLVFRGVNATDKIGVYTIKGIRVPVSIVRNGSSAVLSLSALPMGAYILSVNGKTSKLIKR